MCMIMAITPTTMTRIWALARLMRTIIMLIIHMKKLVWFQPPGPSDPMVGTRPSS